MKKLILTTLCIGLLHASDAYETHNTSVPQLKMPDSNLTFKMIEGYQDYKIVATHFRTDKNELRYILANALGIMHLNIKQK